MRVSEVWCYVGMASVSVVYVAACEKVVALGCVYERDLHELSQDQGHWDVVIQRPRLFLALEQVAKATVSKSPTPVHVACQCSDPYPSTPWCVLTGLLRADGA